MILILAHHYVFNSGLYDLFDYDNITPNMLFLQFFGAFGKYGINCFTIITGYYMVNREPKIKKFIKIWSEVLFYNIAIFLFFLIFGYGKFSLSEFLWQFFPMSRSANTGYLGSMLLMLLLIPFLNKVLRNLRKKEYLFLLPLLIFVESILPSINLNDHYIELSWWLCIVYAVGGYLRRFQPKAMNNILITGIGFIGCIVLMIISIYAIEFYKITYFPNPFFQCFDANKFLPFIGSIFAFSFFNNLRMKYHRCINFMAAGAFGVLMIHANSDTMRQWLWRDVLHNIDYYNAPLGTLMWRSIICVCLLYIVCALIDGMRRKIVESRMVQCGYYIYLRIHSKIQRLN